MTIEYPNGAGQALGDYLATCAPLRTSGSIWYVNSATGTDGSSPAGKNDKKPLATLKQAISNAASGDIIVLMDGHTETSTADADWDMTSKRLAVIGSGLSGGLPTAKLTCGNVGSLGGQIFFGTSGSQLRNVWVTVRAATNAQARVAVFVAGSVTIKDCYFPCDQHDTGPAVSLDGTGNATVIDGCTFVSTATSTSAQPLTGLKSTAAQTIVRLKNTVFDGGTVGFSSYWGCDLNGGAITHFEGEGVSLLRGADMRLHASSAGWLNVATATQGARVDW